MNFFAGDWEVRHGATTTRITIQDAGNNLIRIVSEDGVTVIGFGGTLVVGDTPISISFFRREIDQQGNVIIHFYRGEVERNEDPASGSTMRRTRVRGRHQEMPATAAPTALNDEWTGTRPPA